MFVSAFVYKTVILFGRTSASRRLLFTIKLNLESNKTAVNRSLPRGDKDR